jgi:hypothetical protein
MLALCAQFSAARFGALVEFAQLVKVIRRGH